ncbi:hypothetical protein LZD49_34505, partial [Dyadobacter sp. CY261]|uniref:hypothetical protein n=1 Tax=Dyadobacter sp. CY261 TaxID=2907203 RepID=UPI001F2607BF
DDTWIKPGKVGSRHNFNKQKASPQKDAFCVYRLSQWQSLKLDNQGTTALLDPLPIKRSCKFLQKYFAEYCSNYSFSYICDTNCRKAIFNYEIIQYYLVVAYPS